jgi:hypothetical protein
VLRDGLSEKPRAASRRIGVDARDSTPFLTQNTKIPLTRRRPLLAATIVNGDHGARYIDPMRALRSWVASMGEPKPVVSHNCLHGMAELSMRYGMKVYLKWGRS